MNVRVVPTVFTKQRALYSNPSLYYYFFSMHYLHFILANSFSLDSPCDCNVRLFLDQPKLSYLRDGGAVWYCLFCKECTTTSFTMWPEHDIKNAHSCHTIPLSIALACSNHRKDAVQFPFGCSKRWDLRLLSFGRSPQPS